MGQQITVKILPQKKMTDNDLLGEFLLDSHEIHLVETLPRSARRATLSHELFHAFLAYSGYNQIIDGIHPNMEEALCRAFEHCIGNMLYYPSKIEEWLNGE
jgi:Zn-dependent peptidase ImmA (M78 family)